MKYSPGRQPTKLAMDTLGALREERMRRGGDGMLTLVQLAQRMHVQQDRHLFALTGLVRRELVRSVPADTASKTKYAITNDGRKFFDHLTTAYRIYDRKQPAA